MNSKNNLYVISLIVILSIPIFVLGTFSVFQKPFKEISNLQETNESIKEEPKEEIKEEPKEEIKEDPKLPTPETKKILSQNYANGYWDGWNSRRALPLVWISNKDYRLGYSLGAYDKKNKIIRYIEDKDSKELKENPEFKNNSNSGLKEKPRAIDQRL